MAQKAANEDSVLILLSAQSPNNLKFPERRIILTQSHPKVLIGRSSSRSALGLIPALDNGYFDSPVMSREHAEIEADIPEQVVRIRDAGSMHGTLLNKEPLKTKVPRPLVSGDEIMFGSSIYRNQKTFTPATVTVGMEFQFRSVPAIVTKRGAALTTHYSGQADQSPSRVFTVPDDCSTDENEPLDDNAPLKPHTSSCREVDPRVTKQRDAVLQVDGIIEIDSDSDSDSDMLSDAAPHGCISIVSSDGSHDDLDSGVMAADLDDDESISLTDDEETSSAPASPVESIDLDEFGFANNSGNSSPSWNSVSTDTRSEHEDVQPISGHNSEDEQGVFLYDTESEEMDDIDPVDEYVPGPQPLVYDSAYQPPQTAAAPQQFTLPSIDTAVHSQQGIPPQFNCQLPPVMLMRPVPRQPSPSDALLPVTRPQLGSGDDAVVTVQSLGFKSGKLDYFEAREQNRITVAHSRNHFAPDANAFVQDSSDTVTNAENAIPLITTDNLLVMSSATENGHASPPAFDKEAHTVIMPQVIQPINGRMNSQGSEEPSESTHEPISLAAEDTISPESLKETSEMGIEDQDPSLPPRAASPARTLFWMEQRGKFRAKMEMEASSVAQGKALQAAERSEKSKGAHIGKRKAADISEETEQELLWHEQSASDQQAVRSSPGPVQPGIEMELSTLSFHDTLEEEPTAVRPTKMRKIAERVGYAALGGATVGAMVLTSLIYTAPNFA
ncbi:hypothetical protein DHEL01_v207760 [Diaporthe helianthi]|uniref:FHA domain-containing protein n=1 Tax=Diaporthe helianthi TaxID=158607 RepID=A0A2P5HUC9_DIAHE|nr:hypothetical protein DHEL01_v207760 [Diaporthe helianthi]